MVNTEKPEFLGWNTRFGLIQGDTKLKKYITTYYKKLFSPYDCNLLVMDESYRDDIPQVISQENKLLVAEFAELEVKRCNLSDEP
jgi:hypothetical protein